MSIRLAILDPMTDAGLAKFSSCLPDGFVLTSAPSRNPRDQLETIENADFVITGDAPVTAEMIRAGAAGRLKAVHKWGVGYDNIDLAAARAHGIRVMRTTGSNAVAVAETTLALMLALGRNIVAGHVGLHQGQWLKGPLSATSRNLTGKTVGLVGLGYIGKQVARFLRGFSCDVLYYKPTPLNALEERELGVRHATLDRLVAESDIVSLHCALSSETRGFFNRDMFARMKKGAFLINTARGDLVVEKALTEALGSGHLGGAATDVYAEEPITAGHPFLREDRLIVTPHLGGLAADGYAATVGRMIRNILCVSEGKEPPDIDVLV